MGPVEDTTGPISILRSILVELNFVALDQGPRVWPKILETVLKATLVISELSQLANHKVSHYWSYEHLLQGDREPMWKTITLGVSSVPALWSARILIGYRA